MPPKQNMARANISPVLFMTVDGEPMSFFLRPGAAKRKLQPLITAGGALLCNVQQPGSILLIDPEERGSIPETTAHWYVSTQYIHDCVEKDEQMNLEDYRLNPEVTSKHSTTLNARLNNSKEGSSGLSGGRVAYTAEDDAAILCYVSKHKAEIGGNRLWQEMQKKCVTSHSWQSMKYRYRAQLAKKQPEAEDYIEDSKASEGETKDDENQEADIEKPACEEDTVLPAHSPAADALEMVLAETELTQTVDQPLSTESMTENVEDLHEEVQHLDPQTLTAESTQLETVDAGTSESAEPEGPCLDSQLDMLPMLAESAEQQSIISPQEGSMPEDFLQSLLNTPSPIKRKVKQKNQGQLQHRKTRRQLELEALSSSEAYGKRLRSSSSSAEKPSSPRPLKKTKLAVKSAFQEGATLEQLPVKRARLKSLTESQQEEREEAAVSETPQSDVECNLVLQKGEKKKEKRKLGILELAAKEFEDESESGDDISPEHETATMQPMSTEPTLTPSNAAADPTTTQSNPEPGPSLQKTGSEAEDSSSNHVLETGSREAEPSHPTATEAIPVASRAHLFIFDSESQEDSESLVGENAEQLAVNKDAALCLTQVQLEEDMQQIKDLMNQSNQDLVSVSKALLKTSGDFFAALKLLLNPSSIPGPFWSCCDDNLLVSGDPVVRQQLQEKYGEEGLTKRIVFLELEG